MFDFDEIDDDEIDKAILSVIGKEEMGFGPIVESVCGRIGDQLPHAASSYHRITRRVRSLVSEGKLEGVRGNVWTQWNYATVRNPN
jgi:hypothetical protein